MGEEEALIRDAYQVKVSYHFNFEDGEKVAFPVNVDLLSPEPVSYSNQQHHWAQLENHKCDHCPLNAKDYPECPAATSIMDIIEYFAAKPSCNSLSCRVEMPGRTLTVNKPLQECLSALIGLRLATSHCPTLSHFKLLARFHMPFATPYETVFRTTAMYLLKQYFKMNKGETPDWEMRDLQEFYKTIGHINVKMTERLKESGAEDCGSLHVLSVFSVTMTWLFEDHLKVLEKLAD